MNPNYVGRYPGNPQSNSPFYRDPRMQSTPQTIPHNPLHRGGGAPVGRGFSGHSPAQSPQKHGHHNASPSMYSGASVASTDGNVSYAGTSVAPPLSTAKAPSNGQYPKLWQGYRMAYGPRAPPPQHSQPPRQQAYPGTPPMTTNYTQSPMVKPTGPYRNYQPSTPTMMPTSAPPFICMSPSVRPRFAPPSTPSAVTSVQPQLRGSAPFYPTPQPSYYSLQNPMTSTSGYPAPYEPMQFAPSGHQTMHTPPVAHVLQQPIPQTSSSRKKVITIKDPNTMRDVTKDILQSGKQPVDVAAPSGRSASSSSPAVNVSIAASQEQVIAARFAAQVAAVATQSPNRPTAEQNAPPIQTEGRMETGSNPMLFPPHLQHSVQTGSPTSVIPSGVDTSVPPPSLQGMPQNFQMPPGTPTTKSIISPAQGPSPYVAINAPKGMQVPTISPTSPLRHDMKASRINSTRPDAPVAVVQPVRCQTQVQQHDTPDSDVEMKSVEIAIKHDMPTDKKIEEILTTARAISELEDSKHEVIISDIVTPKNPVEATENLNQTAGDVVQQANEDTSEDLNTDQSDKDIVSSKDDISIINPAQIEQKAETKKVIGSEESKSEIVKPDIPPLENEPTDVVKAPSMLPASLPQEDVVTSVTSLEDKKSVAEEKAEIVLETERTKEEVAESGSMAMSGDSAVVEGGDKAAALDIQVEPSLVTHDSQPALVQNLTDAPSAELPPVQSSESSTASRDTEIDNSRKKEEEQSTKNETPKEEVDAANPFKKKIYDRAFLMQFRFHDSSLEKPSDLPIIEDIIMDGPPPKSSISNALPSLEMYRGGSDFTPNWMGGGGHRGGRSTSRGSRGGGQQRQGGFMPKIIKKVSIQKEPGLSKAETPWKPSKLDAKPSVSSTEEQQTEEILRNVRSILNKLTPSKFSALMQKFQLLPINTEIRLREVINLIFEKAIDEPSFCEAYANMCRTMSQIRVVASADGSQSIAQSGGTVEFRKILLTRCQREFEKDRTNEEVLLQLRKKVEEAKTTEEKQPAKEELEVAEAKERRRMLGNIRFIGELFKLNMLTESIMHNCVMTLFKSREEESLESLCRLLTTIGKDLDHQKGKPRMEQYFTQIEKIIRERKTSDRVRFMLMDVMDLRRNKWVQRAIKSQGPKTIDQIHADAKEEKEQLALQVAAAAAAPPMKPQPRGGRMGSRGSGGHNVDDGWTKVGLQQKPVRYDPQKMKLSKQQFDESNVTLGPSRGKSGWKSGSGSSATKTGSGGYSFRDNIDAPRSSTPPTMNRFSALGATGGQDSYSQRAAGRISSQERNRSDSRGSTGSGGNRNPGREERQSALDTVRRLTSVEKKRVSPVSFGKASPVPAAKPVLDESTLVKKINSILEEYFHLVDVKEATECFNDLKLTSSQGHLIVKTCLEASLEKSSTHRNNTAKLLSHLVSHGNVSPEEYVKGVVDNMELAIDVELDLPKVWSCIAELIAPIFYSSGGKVQLACLTDLAEPLLEEEKAAVFMVEILKKLTQKMTADTAVQYWKDSNLNVEYFFRSYSPPDITEFLQRHNLEEFYDVNVQEDAIETLSKTEMRFNGYVSDITKQLDMNKSCDQICCWIEANVKTEDRSQPIFIRALTSAVCREAIKQGDKNLEVDKDLIQNYSTLLKKCIDDESKELQAVYALQKLYVDLEQPPNILKLLFDYLYDEDVISEQTFFKWEKEDTKESDGKGVALLSVNPFLTWLRDPDVESDE